MLRRESCRRLGDRHQAVALDIQLDDLAKQPLRNQLSYAYDSVLLIRGLAGSRNIGGR